MASNLNFGLVGLPQNYGQRNPRQVLMGAQDVRAGLDDLGSVFDRVSRERAWLDSVGKVPDETDQDMVLAYRNYVDSGDLGQLNAIRDRQAQERQREQEAERARMESEKVAREEEMAKKDEREEAEYKLKIAKNELDHAKRAYADSNKVDDKEAEEDAQTTYDYLLLKARKAGVDVTPYLYKDSTSKKTTELETPATPAATPEAQTPAPAEETTNKAAVQKAISDVKNWMTEAKGPNKLYIPDAEYDAALKTLSIGSDDPNYTEDVGTVLAELKNMKNYRESDRRKREDDAAAGLEAELSEFNKKGLSERQSFFDNSKYLKKKYDYDFVTGLKKK